ncbi:unnamed protein product [Paramecium pentaurelia]|uniref:Transmembrane protein n=1 Tax=Paramecium pentaurelia TaxID=43138 RepID=A0A8S1TMT3_9CILI|nr:unnamed protein product [Paramecium pentaurelia]
MKSFFVFQIFLQVLSEAQKNQREIEQISIYPTQGEIMQVPIEGFLEGTFFSFEYRPKQPFLKLIDVYKKTSFAKGDSYRSISSNGTHFALITNDQNIIVYRWENQQIEQVEPIYAISEQCFNTLFSYQINTIIVDCYYLNNLEIKELQYGNQKTLYQTQSQLPIKTKIKQIINGSNYFTVYAQFFENYSVLTLFSLRFVNITSWISDFIDFDVSQKGFNVIYVLSLNLIQQIKISDQYTFEINANSQNFNFMDGKVQFFSVYYNDIINSQCDQIILVFYSKRDIFIHKNYGCLDSILDPNESGFAKIPIQQGQPLQITFNDQFYLIQMANTLLISPTFWKDRYFMEKIKNSSLLHFNTKTNELFIFDRIIETFQLNFPYLEINLIQYQPQLNTFLIEIYANVNILPIIPKINIKIQILNQDDANVYVITYKNFVQNLLLLGNSLQTKLSGFSGQLLQYQSNQNDLQFGQFINVNLLKVYDFYPLQFEFAQLLNTIYYFQSISLENFGNYLVGIKDQILIFYYCQQYSYDLQQKKKYNCTIIDQTPIFANVSQLQIGYNYFSYVVAGIQYQQDIQIFQLNFEKSISNQTINLEQQFTQYLINFDNIIGLIEYKEIQIISYTMNNKIVLNESLFHEIFQLTNISFQPIQIASNVQYQSAILFINNVNNVVIVAINGNNDIIPKTIIRCQFQISSLNIVNQKIILSYQCNNQTSYCFQVWNFNNILSPFFEKELLSIEYKYQFNFMSDNLFFYVTLENKTIFIYNPYSSRHMSLFKKLELDSIILSTTTISQSSILFYNNTILLLSSIEQELFKVNESLIYQNYYPLMIYRFQVTSLLNPSSIQYTPLQSLTYLSNFTILQNVTQQEVSLDPVDINFQQHSFIKLLNIQRQIIGCYLFDQNSKCFLNNINSSFLLTQNNFSFTLITPINNNYFVLQSNLQIKILNSLLEYNCSKTYDYSSYNFSECLISTSKGNQLFSICQNSTGQYYIIFQIDSLGYATIYKINLLAQQFNKLIKIQFIDNYCFILGDDQLYLLNIQNEEFFQSSYQCEDFSAFPLYQINFIDNSQYDIIVLIFISHYELYYSIMVLGENQYFQNKVDLNYIEEIFNDNFQFLFSYITILDIQRSKILLITGFINQTSWILSLEINLEKQILSFHNIIGTIPPYGNYEILKNIQYQHGFLAMQLIYGNSQFMILIYNLSDLTNQEMNQPLLIYQNQYNLSIASFGMNINKEFKNGTIITFKNNSIYYQFINTYSITCRFRNKQTQINVKMICYNDFSRGEFKFQYQLPNLQKKKQHWYYILLSIIIILLISFYFLVKQKTKRMQQRISEIEL